VFSFVSLESPSLASGGLGGLHLGAQMGQGQGVHVLLQAIQDEDLYGSRHQTGKKSLTYVIHIEFHTFGRLIKICIGGWLRAQSYKTFLS
jgi:hypothetical protein